MFALLVYLLLGLVCVLVVLETCCELPQMRRFRQRFYQENVRELDSETTKIIEQDQLSNQADHTLDHLPVIPSVSEQAASWQQGSKPAAPYTPVSGSAVNNRWQVVWTSSVCGGLMDWCVHLHGCCLGHTAFATKCVCLSTLVCVCVHTGTVWIAPCCCQHQYLWYKKQEPPTDYPYGIVFSPVAQVPADIDLWHTGGRAGLFTNGGKPHKFPLPVLKL